AEGALGPSPLCGSAVVEQERSYGCSGWRAGCKFAIWKTVAGKKLSARTAQALLRKGRSPLLKGFTSKAGKRVDARLKRERGAARFASGPGPRPQGTAGSSPPAFVQPLRAYHARFASFQDDARKNHTATRGSTLGGGVSFFAEHSENCVPSWFCQP